MKEELTQTEIAKIQNLCFENPAKACAIAQLIVDTCQIVSCSTYAQLQGKGKRTVLYQSRNINGIELDNRKFVSLCS